MDDEQIIALYWGRSEDAIRETHKKYARLCFSIAGSILTSREDCEECVNDSYLGLWNAIPQARPARFPVFLGRITRNLALKKFHYLSATRRNPEAMCSLDELGDCVSGQTSPESELENRRVEQAISDFLWRQSAEKRALFIRRYWYFDSIAALCVRTGYSESKVKSILFHMRQKLREQLEKEEIDL